MVSDLLCVSQTQLALCHYSTSYDEDYFSAAEEFRPGRWLRHGHLDRVENFGSIPFGYGIRSCIGKRIAELEIHLALIQVDEADDQWWEGGKNVKGMKGGEESALTTTSSQCKPLRPRGWDVSW